MRKYLINTTNDYKIIDALNENEAREKYRALYNNDIINVVRYFNEDEQKEIEMLMNKLEANREFHDYEFYKNEIIRLSPGLKMIQFHKESKVDYPNFTKFFKTGDTSHISIKKLHELYKLLPYKPLLNKKGTKK